MEGYVSQGFVAADEHGRSKPYGEESARPSNSCTTCDYSHKI